MTIDQIDDRSPSALLNALADAYESGAIGWTKEELWRDATGLPLRSAFETGLPLCLSNVQQCCIIGGLRILAGSMEGSQPALRLLTFHMMDEVDREHIEDVEWEEWIGDFNDGADDLSVVTSALRAAAAT